MVVSLTLCHEPVYAVSPLISKHIKTMGKSRGYFFFFRIFAPAIIIIYDLSV